MKRRFLCCYDYGMGGVWVYILARNPDEIAAKHPSLMVVPETPTWMTDEHQPGPEMTFDIDQPPTGWLTHLAPPTKGN